MEVIYSGQEVKRLLRESIPGYKPVMGDGISSKNIELNKKSNKDSLKSTKQEIKGDETKPVIHSQSNRELDDNKTMLDLEYTNNPTKDWRDRVKKQVTGEDSIQGNKPDEGSDNESNKQFYADAKKASTNFVDNKQKTKEVGLSKDIKTPKKETAFENTNKQKRLNFKNTKFLSEGHMFSLVPEDYKKNGNTFIMKDKNNDEYLIEWKIENDNKSEGVVVKHENKKKLQEDFNRIKSLYTYKSEDYNAKLKNSDRLFENEIVKKNVIKLKNID